MSWDVSIINFSRDYSSTEEIPDNEQPLPLGRLADIHAAILEHFPDTDLRDPTWGTYDCKFGSIEFNIGTEDPVDSMMLHVRASNEIVPPIIEMCRRNNWSGLDCSNGEFLEKSNNPSSGIEVWRKYFNKVIGR
ncbi:MAG: hypothetical protein OEY96_07865 [Gammaproteobacteria bacterium]|nr:hypothetical protein [Gammaproteobacteria bacterium]